MRLDLFADGSSCARNPDGIALHLSPTASVVVIEDTSLSAAASDGQDRRQSLRVSLENVPSTFKEVATALLAFRNKYCTSHPVAVVAPRGKTKVKFARWPLPHFHASDTTRREISAVDGNATLYLSTHAQTVEVQYAALGNTIKQEFSVIGVPDCWRYPLELLRHELDSDAILVCLICSFVRAILIDPLAYQQLLSLPTLANVIKSFKYVAIPLPHVIDPKDTMSLSCNTGWNPSVHTLYSNVTPKPVAAALTETILFRVLPSASTTAIVLEATFLADGSILRADNAFDFATFHAPDNAAEGDMFPLRDAPDTLRDWDGGGGSYAVKPVVAEMARLYMLSLRAPTSPGAAKSILPARGAMTEELAELAVAEVPGVGRFVVQANDVAVAKFESGVTVRLEECRRLQSKSLLSNMGVLGNLYGADGALAEITDDEGRCFPLRVSNPVGYERSVLRYCGCMNR
ncbi:hypothetical protein BC830DRAFT_1166622 [Chytriomyces sp. MP71]|nr:hypothetical protein BC830DRAFT_1166622 [Chytriomyces sp. MP71]